MSERERGWHFAFSLPPCPLRGHPAKRHCRECRVPRDYTCATKQGRPGLQWSCPGTLSPCCVTRWIPGSAHGSGKPERAPSSAVPLHSRERTGERGGARVPSHLLSTRSGTKCNSTTGCAPSQEGSTQQSESPTTTAPPPQGRGPLEDGIPFFLGAGGPNVFVIKDI